MASSPILIGLVGDLLVDRETFHDPLTAVRSLLAAPDIVFGNIEGAYTDTCHLAPSAGAAAYAASHNVQVFGPAGFDVVSLANNHIVDAGHAAMLETRDALLAQGVATCGAGEDLDRARRPAILERKGLRTAFLAYASIFPVGYEARQGVPGLAPMRAYDNWRPANGALYYAPGYRPIEQTIPDEGDLAALKADIAAARERADIVVTSFHWGDHTRPYHLTDHETRTARFCIANGADLVVGHHHHAVRGMEWVDGKPVIYGLGHFVFDCLLKMTPEQHAAWAATAVNAPADSYAVFPRDGWPFLPLHPDTRMTMMAWVEMDGPRCAGMGFVPCRLRPDGHVEAVSPDGAEGREIVAYMEKCQSTQGLNGRIEAGGPLIGGHASLKVAPLS